VGWGEALYFVAMAVKVDVHWGAGSVDVSFPLVIPVKNDAIAIGMLNLEQATAGEGLRSPGLSGWAPKTQPGTRPARSLGLQPSSALPTNTISADALQYSLASA